MYKNKTENEYFNFALKYLNTVGFRDKYEKMKREQYLEQHNHNIWQTKDGKWKTYLDNEDNPRGYVLKTRKTKESIQDLIIKYYKDKELDPYINQVFNEWNTQRLKLGEISEQTYNRYTNDFKRFLPHKCLLRQKKFSQITEHDIESFIKLTIHEKQLSHKSYNGLRTIIRGTFKYGKSQGLTNISITTFFGDLELSQRSFSKKLVDKESEVFTETEILQIKSYLQNHGTIRDLGILLVFETGLRVGELSALMKKDFNKTEKYLHIQRTEISYKDHATGKRICEVRNFPKTEAGDRKIVIPDSTIQILDKILSLNTDDSCDYLFAEKGKRIRSNAFNRRLSRVCDNLQIKHRSMHKIRKTYGTTLLDGNVANSIVAEQMGHKDILTTIKYYYRSNKNFSTKQEQITRALCS